jgi:protein SCO1/2
MSGGAGRRALSRVGRAKIAGMTSSAMQRTLLLVLVALLAAIAVVLITDRSGPGASTASSIQHLSRFDGPAMPPGLRAADFSLTDQTGHRVSVSQYRGHVVILTFIHSLCHDTCPFMVEQIKGALNTLPATPAVPAIGISVAPREDSVANRRRFLDRHQMEHRLAFLNGSSLAMRRVWHAYAIQPVKGPIDHSTFVFLIDRRGIERIGFPADQLTPEGLAHDIRVLEREPA